MIQRWQVILGLLVLFILPSLIFKFVDVKKLLDGSDRLIEKINKSTEEMKARRSKK